MSEEVAQAIDDAPTIAKQAEELAAAQATIAGQRRLIQQFRADAAAWWCLVNDLDQNGTLSGSDNASERARQALMVAHPGRELLAERDSAQERYLEAIKANAEVAHLNAELIADNEELRQTISDAMVCCRGVHYVDVEGEAEAEACDLWIAVDDALRAEHPGADLLAELADQRAVIERQIQQTAADHVALTELRAALATAQAELDRSQPIVIAAARLASGPDAAAWQALYAALERPVEHGLPHLNEA